MSGRDCGRTPSSAGRHSGAVDIVVVSSADGTTLRSTPFHVRFGKMQIIRSLGTEVRALAGTAKAPSQILLTLRTHQVTVSVNGQVCGLRMRLGPSGEAYFVTVRSFLARSFFSGVFDTP